MIVKGHKGKSALGIMSQVARDLPRLDMAAVEAGMRLVLDL